MKKLSQLSLIIFILTVVLFYSPFFFQGKLPVPADTIIGLYHPYRDFYAREYPNGVPYKNFLITDPVRQQYPWRKVAIEQLQRFTLPLWNPYSMAGTPLLGNVQNAALYPLNILFFIMPFPLAWGILVSLQTICAGLFMYLYLRNLAIRPIASSFAAFAFAFSGFSIAWLEWNTIGHTALWLPLSFLAIDKIAVGYEHKSEKTVFQKEKILWTLLLLFTMVAGFFAGHTQTFVYSFALIIVYGLLRWLQFGRKIQLLFHGTGVIIIFLLLTAIVWLPALQFILHSARSVDLTWQNPGWFIPWQHLTQLIAPDFFGNPATLNYWGEWNYGEFVSYIGLFPFCMALYALFFRFDKKTIFFGSLFFLSLVFALPTFIAKIPFLLEIPFLSTAQPTRLLFVTDFSLAVLAALGVDRYLKKPEKAIYMVLLFAVFFVALWTFVLLGDNLTSPDNVAITKRNLIFPSILFVFIAATFITQIIALKRYTEVLVIILLLVTAFDLFRFAGKFTPFTASTYLYPQTKALSFLSQHAGNARVMATDSRILPPNMSLMYHVQTVDGYDPLYVLQYGELVAATERGRPDIRPPFGFNRIITPQRVDSVLTDIAGVKYILSLSDIENVSLKKVFEEGQTRIYENLEALPRAYLVERTISANTKEDSLNILFSDTFNPRNVAVVETPVQVEKNASAEFATGSVRISLYQENRVEITTDIPGNRPGFLVLSDIFYPTWKVTIDGQEKKIVKTNYTFRGVYVPAGKHTVVFSNRLFGQL